MRNVTPIGESAFQIDFEILSNEDSIQSIAGGGAVDDLNYLMQVDQTGEARAFYFDFSTVGKEIYSYSTLNIVIRIVGTDGQVTDCGFSRQLAVENGYPCISNPRIEKDKESGLVSIRYDYASPYEIDPAKVDVTLSNDNGSTWTVATTSMTGDVGTGIATGPNRMVKWNPSVDLPGALEIPITASISIVNSDGLTAIGQSRTGTILITTVAAASPVIAVVSPSEKTRYAKQNGQMFKNESIEFNGVESSSGSSHSSVSSQSLSSSSSMNSSSSSSSSSLSSRSSKSSSSSSISQSSGSSGSSPSSPSSSSSILVSSMFTYVLDSPVAGQVTITKYLGSAAALTIPNMIHGRTVVALANPSSYTSIITSPSTLTSVTIPNSVTNIGSYAFYACWHLTSATMPSGLLTIGDFAFADCQVLSGLTIPNTVTYIGIQAFEYCPGLTGTLTIPDSVTSLGTQAFGDCSGLQAVVIGNGITTINNNTFTGCTSLNSITFGNGVITIGDNAFSGSTALTSVSLPSSLITIGTRAFLNSGLTSIVIPNSVTTLGSNAFVCPNLLSAVIGSGVTSWGTYYGGVFEPNNHYGLCGLQSVTFTPGLTNIGARAFQWCSGLGPSISFPSSITSIGDNAFNMNNYDYYNPGATPPSLNAAYFQGNSPTLGSLAFCNEAAGFTAYYRHLATGFTLPWGDQGYPTAEWVGPPY